MSESAISRRLKSREWKRLFPGVYLVGGAKRTPKAMLQAAVLWAGPEAVVSHRSAAWLYGLIQRNPPVVDVTVRRFKRAPDGIVLHVDPDLPLKPLRRHDGIPVPRIERVIFDLCGSFTREAMVALVDEALRAEKVSLEGLAEGLAEFGGRGRPGTKVLRLVLSRRAAIGVTDSYAEDLFARMARRRGLRLVHHHVVADGDLYAELDFADLERRVDIEIDGGHHRNPVQIDRDKARDAELSRRGWAVLRFTYRDLIERPDWVFSCIQDTLELRTSS